MLSTLLYWKFGFGFKSDSQWIVLVECMLWIVFLESIFRLALPIEISDSFFMVGGLRKARSR
uniref:Uncharacterized protein n=1 Tax=Rhizophora mucronata TaxID=61149 RepID=A0A2P2Q7Q2_RHIMU